VYARIRYTGRATTDAPSRRWTFGLQNVDADAHVYGHRGPAPLEPTAGVSLVAVRMGTGLGRPEPIYGGWTEQPGQ
jgi:hypothetical protein